MKKHIIALLAVSGIFAATAASAAQISINIDGEPLKTGSEPVIENDSTLVPMRDVFEALGAEVQWVESKRTVNAYKGANIMTLTIDSDEMIVNGEGFKMAVPAKIINDKTYVPLRAVSENFNAEVLWDGETRTVTITTPKYDHKTATKKIAGDIKSEDGTVLVSTVYTYPEFENPENNDAVASLNLYVKTMAEEKSKQSDSYKEYALEKLEYCNGNNIKFEPLYVFSGYDVTYDFFNRISLFEQTVISEEDNIQGVSLSSCNYDLNENRMLEKEDILNLTEDDFKELSMYDFYLFENNIILFLNGENMQYYQMGYSPSLGLAFDEETMDYFKINPANGEKTNVKEPKSIFESIPSEPQNERVACKNADELTNKAGFKPATLADEERYTPTSYELVNRANCVVSYTDLNGKKAVVQKAGGDFPNIQKDTSTPVTERLIGNSMVEIFSDDESCYACFTVEKSDGKCFSYSIEMESKDIQELIATCTDVINREQVLK